MSELLKHVRQSIPARKLFRPGQRILVAVSGGLDSLVLLHPLHDVAADSFPNPNPQADQRRQQQQRQQEQ